MSIGCVFCNVTKLTIDLENGLPELFAKECPSDLFPLVKSTQSLSITYYTSVSIQSSSILSSLDSIPWNSYDYLRTITIGCGCCSYMTSFVIENRPMLNTIQIQEKSFNNKCSSGGVFKLSHLPLLKSLSIGSSSFTHFNQFSISDLPSLVTLRIGSDCFSAQKLSSARCSLVSLPLLTECVFEQSCFFSFDHPVLQQLPRLQLLVFGPLTFHSSVTPTLSLDPLPSLQRIQFDSSSFASTPNLSLQKQSSLEEVVMGRESFCQYGDMGCCRISSCSHLRRITIHSSSFAKGHELSLSSSS